MISISWNYKHLMRGSLSPEATEFIHRRFRSLVQELDGDAEIVVHLCRTPNDVVQAIPLDSTVVVGGRSRYMWPTKEERLSRHLIRLGHHVVFAASGGFPRGPSVAAVVVGALMITVPRIVPARAAGQTSADDADLQVSDRTRRAAQSRVASDFSDRPFFITDTVGRLRSDQQTLTAGMIW